MELIDAQNQLVTAIARVAPASGWEQIVADVEVEEGREGYRIDSVTFAIVRSSSGDYSDPQFDLDRGARERIVDLYKTQRTRPGQAGISGFQLQIESDGKYRFDYNYGRPKRLNGEWDAEKEERLDNYLQTYLESLGTSPKG